MNYCEEDEWCQGFHWMWFPLLGGGICKEYITPGYRGPYTQHNLPRCPGGDACDLYYQDYSDNLIDHADGVLQTTNSCYRKGAPPKECNISVAVGSWLMMNYEGIQRSWSWTHGVQHSYTEGNTETWGESMTQTVNAGFEFGPFSGGASVSSESSHSIANEYSTTFTMTEEETYTMTADPGALWMWQFRVTDSCGTSFVNTTTYVLTNNVAEEPCCLPGYAASPTQQHGPCVPDKDGKVYSVC